MWVSVAAAGTGITTALALSRDVALGITKYSHNACVCVVDASNGRLLFAQQKERLSRVKNDGGAVGDLVRHALEGCGRSLRDVVAVAANNHHRSVAEEEAAYTKCAGLGIEAPFGPPSEEVLDTANLFAGSIEVSHHLAHAVGAAAAEGASECVAVVMDGMGDRAATHRNSKVRSDAALDGWDACTHVLGKKRVASFDEVPDEARECESVYALDASAGWRPVWKRWSETDAHPSFGFSDWFLSLDSLGAAYSTVAHVIFGDWNACGKVMGLAPWALLPSGGGDVSWGRACDWPRVSVSSAKIIEASGAGFEVNRAAIRDMLAAACEELPPPDRDALLAASGGAFPPRRLVSLWTLFREDGRAASACRACCAALALAIQTQLEAAAVPLVLRAAQQHHTLVLCGGVALNSVLNGKIEAALSERNLLVPAAPGDEGVALGCAVVALNFTRLDPSILPFAGRSYDDLDDHGFDEWLLLEEETPDEVDACAAVVAATEVRGIAFWFEGASEFGPRALGHRSILASPADAAVVDVINEAIKAREDFRPLAPSVLEEFSREWFGLPGPSPYMSRVWTMRYPDRAPACAHLDASSRPQTVSRADPALRRYRDFIEKFYARTGLPLVLDTSFNTKPREPIVETLRGAVSSFLYAVRRARTLYGRRRRRRRRREEEEEEEEEEESRPGFATRAFPARRHHDYLDDDDGLALRLNDLDEPFEDPSRTGRGRVEFCDHIQAAIYDAADGDASAADIASALVEEGLASTPEDVYLRLADLWRQTLVKLNI
ncbi:hypothetical protein CTAYLR_000363 [Chrysophaeum taylorii]|uniref:Carbamoyltransferase n=1 Tax=Chrysophaeum taylorii TaxID=2483200 RepID=A0AAD7UHV7_9STRA|nr:hypothetical protein CTAYLR_000363 [Chrysophaeum taylorii]